MFYNLLSTRAIQVGIAFFVLVVAGSLLYSWYAQQTTQTEFARPGVVLQDVNRDASRTATIDTSPVDFAQTPSHVEVDGSQMAGDTDAFPIDEAIEFADIADAFLPDDFVLEDAPAEDVQVSPYGFGPYPEVPADYPGTTPMWERDLDAIGFSEEQKKISELLSRVLIQLWVEQGVGSYLGGYISQNTGLVYPYYENTIYVKRTVHRLPDGTESGATAQVLFPGNMIITGEEIETFRITGETPPGLQVLQIDTDGIDPYEFLNLQR